MRINALRRELVSLFEDIPSERPPALRRSLKDEWLYAADLPAVFAEGWGETLGAKLKEAGWETLEEDGWVQLRKNAAEPPEGWYGGTFGPEAGCCLSLLARHAADAQSDPDPAQRMLIKAGEQGRDAYEAACAALHRDWAARLRQRRPLPPVSRRYFGK